MALSIFDTNHDVTPHIAAVVAALGAGGTVIRYINPLGTASEKTVKPPEARAIAAAGLRLGLVCEGWGGSPNFAHNDITAATGTRDGGFCANYAATVGAPAGAAIYFAVDTDATAAQIRDLVVPYFTAVRAAVAGRYRVGIYGCGAACRAVLTAGAADLAWLANATGWNGSKEFHASGDWNILQHLPATIAGIDTDPDETNPVHPDIGDFVPFSSSAPSAPTKETTPVTTTATPVPAPAATVHHFTFDIASIESALMAFQSFAPMLSAFLPLQLKPFVALLPVMTTLLDAGKALQASGGDSAAIATILSTHLHTVADQIKATIPTPVDIAGRSVG